MSQENEDLLAVLEEKYEGVKELLSVGKEKGYLLYDEINELLPDDIQSSEDLDNIFYLFGEAGIEMIDSALRRPTIPSGCISAKWVRFLG